MKPPRRPAAFAVEPQPAPRGEQRTAKRPRALDPRDVVTPAEIDVFAEPDPELAVPPPPLPARRGSWLKTVFLTAAGTLVSLAIGLWAEALVRDLFARAEWLGWLAAGVAAIALVALAAIVLREMLAVLRLASVEKLRARAVEAVERDDMRLARGVVSELTGLLSGRPETAAGRRALRGLEDEIVDGSDLVRIAEAELLGPLDLRARAMILDAAKRVSVVTAVSPRAFFDIAYVVFEASRLIRRLATLYGARPGTLGFLRLARGVLAHLAVTGVVAAGDDLVHQIVGQGLAARLSAKLGEGVVNGMMTARIGVAAMDTVRPLPFAALKRPGMSDFLASLARFSRSQPQADEP